ncbi:glycosyltransferase family 39 protein [Streptomyces sp. NPDC087422]|uniref:glycosyltransferase family 39 protein n=1 Tax=Streptomyces sp. NPDC087422 TaxID=3365786 RepID=UPI00380731BF
MNEREVLNPHPDHPDTIPISIIPQPRNSHHGQGEWEIQDDSTGDRPAPGGRAARRREEKRQEEKRRGMGRAAIMLPPMLVTLVAGGYRVGAAQVREDEAATWWAAHLSWSDLGRLLDNTDVVLAPYYVLMHFWVSVAGSSPAMLRVPSVVAMAVTAGLLALLGRRMFDAPTGLVAGLVFAVLPVTTRFAQEARPFALAALSVVAGALLLYRALDHVGADRWGGYAFGMLCTGLFHPVAATVVVAYLLITLATERQRTGAWLAVTLVPVAPLFAVLMLARGQNHQDPQGGTDVHALLRLPQELIGSQHAALAVGGLALLGVLLGRRNGVPLLVWAVLPPVALFGLRSYGNLFTPSYFVFTVPAVALLAGAGVCGLAKLLPGRERGAATRQIVLGAVAAVAVAAVSLPAFNGLRTDPRPGLPDYQAASAWLRTQTRGGDGVVYSGELDKAMRGTAYQLRAVADPPDAVYVTVSPQRDGTYTGQPCSAPVVCTKDVQRIWLVATAPRTPYAGMTADEGRFLQTEYKAGTAKDFAGGLRITLFDRLPRKSAR